VSTIGAGSGWLGFILLPLLVLALPVWSVLLVGIGGALVVAMVAFGIASGYLRSPGPSTEAVNLEARRGGEPRIWLVAHLDSKSQVLSLAGRVAWVVVFALGLAAVTACLVFRLAGPVAWPLAVLGVLPMLAGGAALSRSGPRDDSPGAVDNATGVVAALTAAAALPDREDIGVLITDAEEFGMVGARAWGHAEQRHAAFVNFDGIDGCGRFRVMAHPARGRGEDGGTAARLAAGVARALEDHGFPAVRGPLPPGVLVDGVVLARCGMPGVTVSRGTVATLRVIHTLRDGPGRVRIDGAIAAGRAVAAAIRSVLTAV
jgi:hypothetical protein